CLESGVDDIAIGQLLGIGRRRHSADCFFGAANSTPIRNAVEDLLGEDFEGAVSTCKRNRCQ
ncbi:hypothetical protein, partial [Xanthomonas oryzae]|uniref:hypothetical protein n=1 Tax=Xanthomonas oryzae TaxID=347 RepID=UPI001C4A458B